MLRSPKSIVAELDNLIKKEQIDVSGFFDVTEEFKYEPIQHYIKSLSVHSKPETAAHELFKSVIKDVLKYDTFNEVNIGSGFVDFAVRESGGNPILIELKPFMKLLTTKGILKPISLDFVEHRDQILKYLKNNEYVILTNLMDTFLFSRNAIIEFEPFKALTFTELLNTFLEYQGNLWDTIRRIEDQNIKVDLDKTFFEDLKNWYHEFRDIKIIPEAKFTKDELIVLLLNKIIFIRTLDDLGLIQFNYIIDEYLNKKDKWEAKGSERILTTFFNELEEYFDYFYDTELFKQKFWSFVEKSKSNTDRFLHIFETTLGMDAWNRAFGRGMLHYNYRWIDEDVFGKAYETFIAENKKDSGIFYTPKEITTFMAKSIVDNLFGPIVREILETIDKDVAKYAQADELLEKMYQIKIIDTASGSGSFLIKVLKEIYSQYIKIFDAVAWVESVSGDHLFDLPASIKEARDFRNKHHLNKSDHIKLVSKIILRHIYAADIDERALETAKTNIWKEAIKLNPPIYNYKKLNGESSHILPNLELNFIKGDSLADLPIGHQLLIIQNEFADEILKLHQIRKEYISNPFHPEGLDEALQIKQKIFNRLKKEIPAIEQPVFICLDFWHAYIDENGASFNDESSGFHGVIGNPPWETIKPIEKEFAEKGKGELDILDFKEWFKQKLKSDEDFAQRWKDYQEFYDVYKEYITKRYVYQGVGDPNYYKYFLERDIEILRHKGFLSLLVPSGIQTDLGCSDLRNLLMKKYLLKQLFSFENRGYKRSINGEERTIKPFPDVDNRFKFTIVNMEKYPYHPFSTFDAKFYMHDPLELTEREAIHYNLEMVEKFSPENLSIMEFANDRDYEICKKIRASHSLFVEHELKFRTEFHMTNDSSLFNKMKDGAEFESAKFWPLYEGKMIHQYDAKYSDARYFIVKNDGIKKLTETEKRRIKREFKADNEVIDKLDISLDCKDFRLVYRAIGRSTDERTLISTIIPDQVFIGHSMNYLSNYSYNLTKKGDLKLTKTPLDNLVYLMVLFNSLIINYYIRNKISANLTMNFLYELPIPSLNKRQINYLVKSGSLLLYNKSNDVKYDVLMKELKVDIKQKINPIELRGEVEIFIAKEIYKISKEEWEHITSTFVYGNDSETKKELDEIIEYTLRNY